MGTLGIQTELDALDAASGLDEKHYGKVSKHSARLQAAVQIEVAGMLAAVMTNLERGLAEFTKASDQGTKELSLWTKRYSWAAWALVFATVVQIGISVTLLLNK